MLILPDTQRRWLFSRYAIALVSAGLVLLSPTALWAQTIPAPLRTCSTLADDTARLKCFDQEIARILAKDSAAQESPPVSRSPQETLGLSGPRRQRLEAQDSVQPQKTHQLQAHVLRTSAGSLGHDVFELDNGQVWQQTETQTNFMARPGDEVTVKAGALGSFWLTCGARQATRVKRLR